MDRNTIIGFVLIFILFVGFNHFFWQPEMEAAKQKKIYEDSLKQVQQNLNDSLVSINPSQAALSLNDSTSRASDTISKSVQNEQRFHLKNDLVDIEISNLGAVIKSAKIINYKKIITDSADNEIKTDLYLLEDSKNTYDYVLKSAEGNISSKSIYFNAVKQTDNELVFEGVVGNNGKLTQTYKLNPNAYTLDYTIRYDGVSSSDPVQIRWENYLDRLEKNTNYERFYSSVYYKEKDENTDYCSCNKDDKASSENKNVNWVSHSNQFFNSTLISELGFSSGSYETVMLAENSEDLKLLKTNLNIPSDQVIGKDYKMKWFIGPNVFSHLKPTANHLEDIIPYGWSIFGTINKYALRPLFSFLAGFIGSKGIIILLMTLIVKLLVFPLAYKMLESQAKMTALKPEIDKVKNKYKDDLQKQQMETMKMYNEFGVNPLGGCFPLILQMPIWIALYRFFPASIEFRQESFLWATDLTSYDVFYKLPFSIPMFGDTISLFAFLWMVSTLIFSYYSSQTMDFSSNPAMKYMQYLMPFIFWFMFNKTAAGLTCYMFFSNLLNIMQTIIGKNFLFDNEKLRAKLELNKSKPKKKGGFQERLEEMMKEQQRIQQEKLKKKN